MPLPVNFFQDTWTHQPVLYNGSPQNLLTLILNSVSFFVTIFFQLHSAFYHGHHIPFNTTLPLCQVLGIDLNTPSLWFWEFLAFYRSTPNFPRMPVNPESLFSPL
jgi:hypothetical protein